MQPFFNRKISSPVTPDGLKTRLILSMVVAVLVTTIVYASSFLEATGFSLWQLPIGFCVVFFLWQLQVMIARRLDKILPWQDGFLKRIFWQIIACFLASFILINLAYLAFKLYSIRNYEGPGSGYDIYLFLLVNSIIFILFLLVTGLQLGYTFILQWQESQLLAGKLRDENNQAKIMGYKQQLNPHFIFNNLNILTALIEKDQASAKVFVEQFASSYRYLLQASEKELVPLRTELSFIESYIYLLKVRFQNSIHYTLNIPANLLDLYIPPFSIQLLIENCVKHNITSQSKPLLIEVYSNDKTVIVKNNLQLKEQPEQGTHTGLKNIINRYHFFTDIEIKIEKTNDYFSVSLPLLESNEYINYRR